VSLSLTVYEQQVRCCCTIRLFLLENTNLLRTLVTDEIGIQETNRACITMLILSVLFSSANPPEMQLSSYWKRISCRSILIFLIEQAIILYVYTCITITISVSLFTYHLRLLERFHPALQVYFLNRIKSAHAWTNLLANQTLGLTADCSVNLL